MRDKIIFYGLRGLASTPLIARQWLGALVGWLLYLIPNEQQRIARINIALCLPEFSARERRSLLRRSLVENARILLEMPSMWIGDPRRWLGRIEPGEGGELVARALAKGGGLIAAGPHLGSWELALHHLCTLAPVTALYRPPRNHSLDGLIREGRSRMGARLAPATPQGVKRILAGLKGGGMFALLCDQEPKAAGGQGGVFAPFFGQPADSMVLLCRLARNTGASVLFWYLERLPGGRRYRMHWLLAPEGIDDPDIERAVTAMNRGLEACIRRCPKQYNWSYKRFYTQPEGRGTPYHPGRGGAA